MRVLRGELRWQDFSWWAMWVLACIPAGALAAVGLVEFNWGGPPYDGGFMGDLVFFGGFLALGQIPFVTLFAWSVFRQAGNRPWQKYSVAAGLMIAWPLAGFVGWTLGSFIEVPLSTSIPLYSTLRVLAGSVRWLVVGVAEGIILAWACVFLSNPVSDGAERDAAGDMARGTGRISRVALFSLCAASWVVASVVGGLLYEAWAATEVAARSNDLNAAIGGFLQSLGVAENVAYVVIPHALFVPLLYGIPTGVVFTVILHTARRPQSSS